MNTKLTHFDDDDNINMVDISNKNITKRIATAIGSVLMKKETLSKVIKKNISKGDVMSIAQFAGIMGAKKTSELIPLCHSLNLSSIKVKLKYNSENNCIDISSEAIINARTGVEMEALAAVSIAALTIYDMCKSIDKEIEITNIKLLSKSGGKSGDYRLSNDKS